MQLFGIERGGLIEEARGKDLASVMMRGESFSVCKKDVVIASWREILYTYSRMDLFIKRSCYNGFNESVAFVHGAGWELGDSFTGEVNDLERMKFVQVLRYVVMPDREREYMKIAKSKWCRLNESRKKEGRMTLQNWNRMCELQVIIWKLAGDDGTFGEYIQKSA